MYRTLFTAAARPFSTCPIARKSATEKVSEIADKVNKGVGQTLASAIESGGKATQKTKETVVGAKDDASHTAGKVGDIAGQKANKASAEAKATKEEVKDATRK